MSEENQQLKLYVWEDVLHVYTAGMAVVLAHNEQEARGIMKRDIHVYNMDIELPFSKVQVVTEPAGFYVYGGG